MEAGRPRGTGYSQWQETGVDLRCSSRGGGQLSDLESILEIEDRTC